MISLARANTSSSTPAGISSGSNAELVLLMSGSALTAGASYFSTLFKKETGRNFQNYLTEYRIEKAKELLRTTNETMMSVAEQVGYQDTRYFSQCFVKVVGVKPSLYRKMYS